MFDKPELPSQETRPLCVTLNHLKCQDESGEARDCRVAVGPSSECVWTTTNISRGHMLLEVCLKIHTILLTQNLCYAKCEVIFRISNSALKYCFSHC